MSWNFDLTSPLLVALNIGKEVNELNTQQVLGCQLVHKHLL